MYVKHLVSGFIVCALLVACGGNKSEKSDDSNDSPGLMESIGGVKNLNKMADAASDWEKIQKDLLEKTPLTNDELKTLIPESLSGLKRMSFNVGSGQMMGMNTAEADYSDDQNKSIDLTVMDGAGEAGSSVVGIYMMTLSVDREEQTESGYSKTAKINGHRANVTENKGDDWVESEISTLVADRYLITLKGTGVALGELEKAFNELPLNKLK